jgi:SARP family transcriptional regulator, regulator of embCAB operon
VIRVYIAGEIVVESEQRLLREADLPARQGRLAFAYLVDRRAHAVARQDLADVLWPDRLPDAWAVSLSAIVSKLRVALESVGLPRDNAINTAFGCYQLRLPADAWVDLEVAASALHSAEAAVAGGRAADAYGDALVALTILRRPFLAGARGGWVDARRETLRGHLVRALDCMISCQTATHELALALRNAEELVALEPFRESGYRHLMRLHALRGDRAQALQVYETCRARLVDELGVGPSVETKSLQLELLKAGSAPASREPPTRP